MTKHKLLQPSKESRQDRHGKCWVGLAIAIIGLLVITILIFLCTKGVALFVNHGIGVFDFMTGVKWSPSEEKFGALPMILTSFVVTLVAVLIAIPLALLVALAITEILPERFQNLLRSLVELMMGIPSVIYGFIGLTVVVPQLRQWFGGTGFGLLAAIVVLVVMIFPTITSMTVDTLRATPSAYRIGSMGLGATRWQTIWHVILPYAKGGIITALIFGMARAFGEALAVQMVIGNTVSLPNGWMNPAATLTSVITTGIGNSVMGTPANDGLWSLALVLLLMSLVFNGLAQLTKGRAKS